MSNDLRQNSSPVAAAARQDHEAPSAIAVKGWRYHHIGIPTQTPRPGEIHLPHLKIHVAGFETSPYGIQWMRFDADAPYPEMVKTVPHVAFEVDDLAAALEGKEILTPPNSPSEGVTVAMIVDNGAPVELLEFARASKPA
ncbi:MAG: VOC family protein [Terracidiphilus sp.]